MESVDAETGGKRGGGTHFTLSSGELFLDYQYFSGAAEATRRIDEETDSAKELIERGDVPGIAGGIVGKFVIAETGSAYPNNKVCLRWSNTNRYARVCSESTPALDEFRTIYEL